jgi:hypothetical protein
MGCRHFGNRLRRCGDHWFIGSLVQLSFGHRRTHRYPFIGLARVDLRAWVVFHRCGGSIVLGDQIYLKLFVRGV